MRPCPQTFETTIRVLGGLVSAFYHSGGDELFYRKAVEFADMWVGRRCGQIGSQQGTERTWWCKWGEARSVRHSQSVVPWMKPQRPQGQGLDMLHPASVLAVIAPRCTHPELVHQHC